MSTASAKPQINSTLEQQLKIVVGRERLRRVCIYLAITWCSAAIVAAIIFVINRAAATSLDLFVPQAWLGIGIGTILITLVAVVMALLTTKSVDQIARRIEIDFPELDSVLITAMEQRSVANQPLGFLQQDVIRRAVYHSYRNEWKSIIPSWQILLSSTAAAAGLLGLTLGGISLLSISRPAVDPSVHLFDDVAVRNSLEYRATIQPGNTEIERGTSLLILAQFEQDVPPNATLTFSTIAGVERTVAMTKSLDDPVFAGRMSQVNEPVKYKVAFDEQNSEEFIVTVFDFPAMVRSDAVLVFPTFTQMPEKTLQDVRRISAVVGTTATLKFFVT